MYGLAAYTAEDKEVVVTYIPYNFLKHVPVVLANGTHSFSVPELPAGSYLEVLVDTNVYGAPRGFCYISSITVSGNTVTYTVSHASTYTGQVVHPWGNLPAFALFARR